MSKPTRRVGRPRKDQLETPDVAATVRAAATRLFAERGFLTTHMRDIAKASGVTPGALYHHYPSKEALLLEVIQAVLEQEGRALGAVLTPGLSATQSLLALLRHHQNDTGNHAALWGAMEHLPEDKQADIAAFFTEHLAQRLAAVLRSGVESGEFREHDVQVSTWTILSVLRGMADVPPGVAADLPALTLELLLTGLGAAKR